ncbi:MAG TPA: hypothetical protein DIT25_00260 [Candidatus Moranbacteria bacterium]|nr:hypothetical protein [Candidatus Moranbacteria bacterium]
MKKIPLLYKHNMLRSIIENIHVSINIFDKNGKRIFVNPYYYHLSGKKTGSLLGEKFNSENNYREVNDSMLDKKMQETLKTGKIHEIHNYFYRPQNKKTIRFFDILIGPLKDKKGAIIGAYSMAKDETSRYLAKNKLVNLNKNLEKKVDNRTKKLEKLNNRLKRLSGDKDLLLSHVAHEIKTMLTVIKGNVEIIGESAKNSNDKMSRESFIEIDNEIGKLSRIVSDLVFITKAEAYSNLFHFEKLDLVQITKEIIKKYRTLDKKNFSIRLCIKTADRVIGYADKVKIQTVISNMIENAMKYGKGKGALKICVFHEKSKVKMVFTDNGQGIEKENLECIFDPFFQAKKTNNPKISRGFGLGLAICKKIISAHKGSIVAESQVGKGAVFTITLPSRK